MPLADARRRVLALYRADTERLRVLVREGRLADQTARAHAATLEATLRAHAPALLEHAEAHAARRREAAAAFARGASGPPTRQAFVAAALRDLEAAQLADLRARHPWLTEVWPDTWYATTVRPALPDVVLALMWESPECRRCVPIAPAVPLPARPSSPRGCPSGAPGFTGPGP